MRSLKNRLKERGVALMMTLGVLALLLIMAMSFAYTTRTERLASAVNTDLIQARLFAESGVERAIAFIRDQYVNNPWPGGQFFVPNAGDSESWWVSRNGRYLASVSSVTDGIGEALSSTTRVDSTLLWNTPASSLHSAVGWIPIKVDHGAGTESCVALIAYLVSDETGKINPKAATGDLTGLFDGLYGASVGATEQSGDPETRLGLHPGEIALADIGTESSGLSYTYGDTVGDRLRTEMPDPGRWFSDYHIINGIDASTYQTQAWLYRYIWSLRTENADDPESYLDNSGDEYHRCDLNNVDWNNTDVGSTLWSAPVPFDDPYDDRLTWINSITPATVRNQVKANIIDFFDDDVGGSAATDTENDYDGDTATYVGLEEVPYINEVFVRARYQNRTPITIGTPPITIGYDKTVVVAGRVELVNMFEEQKIIPDVQLEIEVEFDHPDATLRTETISLSWSSVVVDANDYHTTGWAPDSFVRTFPLPAGPITNFRITRVRVTASDGSPATSANLWDFAEIDAMPDTGWIDLDRAGPFSYINAEVDDPRLNTSGTGPNDNWKWESFSNDATIGTANGVNDHCNPDPAGDDHDAEIGVTDPVHISTAFIRNGDALSFWELGAIHRGERWRTLNIHSSDNTPASRGSYAYGDWPLLNQVKFIENRADPSDPQNYYVAGRINAWTRVPEVWKALVQNIRVGCDYGSPASGGVLLDNNTTLLTFAGDVASNMPTWSATADTLRGRGAIVGNGEFSNSSCGHGVTQDTDAKQEEIIGKVVGLLGDRHSFYKILVCSKAVQDIGELPAGMTTAPAEWIEYETGRYCRPLAEQKVMALVHRDVVGNRFRILRFEYLEE